MSEKDIKDSSIVFDEDKNDVIIEDSNVNESPIIIEDEKEVMESKAKEMVEEKAEVKIEDSIKNNKEDYSTKVLDEDIAEKSTDGILYSSEMDEEKREAQNEEKGFFSSIFGHKNNKQKVFDEDLDKKLAKEVTKNVPPAVIEKEDVKYEAPYTENVEYEDVDFKDGNNKVQNEVKDPKAVVNKDKKGSKLKRRMTMSTLLLFIGALLFWLAPDIQKTIFQTKDNSLIFSSTRGFFGPRMGILEIVLGLFGISMLFNAMLTSFKEKRINKNVIPSTLTTILKRLGFLLMLLIPLGVFSLFNYTEFRNNDIRFASLLNQNDIRDYSQVSNQKAYLEGKDIIYEITANSKKADFAVNKEPSDTVKLLDKKMNPSREVMVDNLTFQEIVKSGLYTEKEAFDIFKFNLKKN